MHNMKQTLQEICATIESKEMVRDALLKSILKPKRKLSIWDYKFHKFMIRTLIAKNVDGKTHEKCIRCRKQIITGQGIKLCKGCYEQSERDYLLHGNLTRFDCDKAELLEKEQCEICGIITRTRWLDGKEHCMKCFREKLR